MDLPPDSCKNVNALPKSKEMKKRKFAPGSAKLKERNKKLLFDAGHAPGQKDLLSMFRKPNVIMNNPHSESDRPEGENTSDVPILPINYNSDSQVVATVPKETSVTPSTSTASCSYTESNKDDFSNKSHADPNYSVATTATSCDTLMKGKLAVVNLNQSSSSSRPMHESPSDRTEIDLGIPSEGVVECDEETTDSDNDEVPYDIQAEVNYFVAPSSTATLHEKIAFSKNHPIQPLSSTTHKLPFDSTRIYKRQLPNKQFIDRHWVSYSTSLKRIFCSVCMVFSHSKDKSSFATVGCQDWNHIYSRVIEHESSHTHKISVDAFLLAKSHTDIESLINTSLVDARRQQISNNRKVLSRLIEIIFFIGKLGLAYRGKDEAAYFLANASGTRGVFLELVLLFSKFDGLLKTHVDKAVADSSRRKEKSTGQGRGGLVTFLSKTTINKIIIIVGKLIKEEISRGVKRAGMFSVQVDSTQDITVIEQCAIVVRYVDNHQVNERLLGLVDVKSSTGQAYFKTLEKELTDNDLKVENIIGCSFDGAANMSGQYKGLQKFIQDGSPNSSYTWCHAHVLNLVVTDATHSALASKNYFGLLNRTACFLNESYKRMTVWKRIIEESDLEGHKKLQKLKKIADTRWWRKSRAIGVVFGSYSDQRTGVYNTLVTVLDTIATCGEFDAKNTSEAKSLLQMWLSYETVLISFTFLLLFDILTPASDYLQKKGLDYVQAWRIVTDAKTAVNTTFDKFPDINTKAAEFMKNVDETKDFESDVDIQITLPPKRISHTKRMDGEKSRDEKVQDAMKRFEIETFKVIVNQVSTSLEERFARNERVFKCISCFDPRRFSDILIEGIPLSAVDSVANMSGIDAAFIKSELTHFARNFDRLKMSFRSEFLLEEEIDILESGEEDAENVNHCETRDDATAIGLGKRCSGCIPCCFKLLHEHNLHSSAYSNLYIAYKTVLTLSCTQVPCERIFSKLKIIKNRLRSTLQEDLLEAFMLMSVEKDILGQIKHEDIIDRLAHSSTILTRMLVM